MLTKKGVRIPIFDSQDIYFSISQFQYQRMLNIFCFIYLYSVIQQKMKHSLFKIRKGPFVKNENMDSKESLDVPQHHFQQGRIKTTPDPLGDKMNTLMNMFQQFMTHAMASTKHTGIPAQDNSKIIKNLSEFQARDRHVHLDVPLPTGGSLSKRQIQIWITQVFNSAFSTSFNYYLTEQMTFEQTKVFSSQTILGNLLRLTQKYKLTSEQMENIDKHIGEGILEYLQKKYPLTQSQDVNKALEKQVQQTDHLDLLSNDFLYNSNIMFEYRQSGNYNDMIMRVLNKAQQYMDSPSNFWQILSNAELKEIEMSNYRDFQTEMSQLFEKVYDEQWMIGKDRPHQSSVVNTGDKYVKKIYNQTHHDKYVEKVKSYTNYLIGRKISENTIQFDEKELKSNHLQIKSPAFLRILTKWCEQLWEKFDKQNYFTERAESIQLQKPQMVNPFFKWMKTAIDKLMADQKVQILKFKKQLDENSYNQQYSLLLKNLQDDQITFIPKLQMAYGKFATQMVKNLRSYILLYLNRIIHGLLKVSKNFYDKQVDKSWDDWQAPPNLVTLRIGDLMRCRCSSKQRQIVRIFKELKDISNTNPQRMKIVRIKNRLNKGTNDILINVKFNNMIICEIQLEVINKSKSKFIQCSNAFSHYIYEMKRSIFGPISELCNIWNNFQSRSSQYNTILANPQSKDNPKQNQTTTEVSKQKCEHVYETFTMPFRCNCCENSYYHNNYIISNKICNKCKQFKCYKCQINQLDQEELKTIIFKNKKDAKLKDSCKRIDKDNIPNQGVCVKIESNTINLQIFKYLRVQGKYWLLGIKQQKIYQIKRVRSKKQKSQFMSNYCIFEFSSNQNFIKITDAQALKFTVEQYVKQTYKQQKQVLILTQIRLTLPQMQQLMKIDGGYEKNKKKIKRLEFASNYLDNIQYFNVFQNVTTLNLDYNYLVNTQQVAKFKNLQKLEMRENSRLVQIGKQFCQLQKLEEFKMSNCIINIIPQDWSKMTALTNIKLDKNRIKELPRGLCELTGLKQLSIGRNQLAALPQNIGNMTNLRKLNLNNNQIQIVPQSIVNLTNLIHISLQKNKVKTLPQGWKNCTKLQKIQLQNNVLIELPNDLTDIQTLKILNISFNQIQALKDSFAKCKNLITFLLNNNKIVELPPSMSICLNIQTITLNKNMFKALPDWLGKTKKTPTTLILSDNSLTQFPSYLLQLSQLDQVSIHNNKIASISQKIGNLVELTSLTLSNNIIKQLPESLVNLTKLNYLNFQNNIIQKIPNNLSSLKLFAKQSVNAVFSNNKITQIDQSFFSMQKNERTFTLNQLTYMPIQTIINKLDITTMDFNHNCIKQIPRIIGQFTELTYLNLSYNQIQLVPIELSLLKKINIRQINLNENPIKINEWPQFLHDKIIYQQQPTTIRIPQYSDSSDDE